MPLKPDTLALTALLALLTALGPLSTDMYLPSLPAIGRDFSRGDGRTQGALWVCLARCAASSAHSARGLRRRPDRLRPLRRPLWSKAFAHRRAVAVRPRQPRLRRG